MDYTIKTVLIVNNSEFTEGDKIIVNTYDRDIRTGILYAISKDKIVIIIRDGSNNYNLSIHKNDIKEIKLC